MLALFVTGDSAVKAVIEKCVSSPCSPNTTEAPDNGQHKTTHVLVPSQMGQSGLQGMAIVALWDQQDGLHAGLA